MTCMSTRPELMSLLLVGQYPYVGLCRLFNAKYLGQQLLAHPPIGQHAWVPRQHQLSVQHWFSKLLERP